MKELKVAKWLIEREQAKAKRFSIYFEITRRTNDIASTPLIEDDCVYVAAKIEGESEKAVKAVIQNGGYGDSNKTWSCWIPKSAIKD